MGTHNGNEAGRKKEGYVGDARNNQIMETERTWARLEEVAQAVINSWDFILLHLIVLLSVHLYRHSPIEKFVSTDISMDFDYGTSLNCMYKVINVQTSPKHFSAT
jgi:hypothetical protein